jgi:hypothetical protein
MSKRTALPNAAWIATAGLVVASIVGAAGIECSGGGAPPPSDAGGEVKADGNIPNDAAPLDATEASVDAYCAPNAPYDAAARPPYDAASSCGAGFIGDGEVVSDWPGWVRPRGIEACCKFDVPLPDAGPAPAAWHACATGPAGCEEWLPVGPLVMGKVAASILHAKASRDPHGQPNMLFLEVDDDANLPGVFQDFFSDVSTGATLGAWRLGFGGVNDGSSDCITYSTPVGDSVALAWQNWFTLDMGLAFGTPASLMAGPGFASVPPNPRDTERYWGASTTTYAFDTAFTAVVARVPIGVNVAISTPACAPPLVFNFVEGNDVFANLNDTSQWQVEYLVHSDGSVTLYRAVSGHHVSAFATDGTTMFWVESYGNPVPSGIPTQFDVYSAPYTADAATLDATATKIASYVDPTSLPSVGVAFAGLYAVDAGVGRVFIVRNSNDEQQLVTLPAGESYYSLLFATTTEFWGTVRATAQHNEAVWRVPLGAW